MSNCPSIDPLLIRYVDGDLSGNDRRVVDEHLQDCPPCRARVSMEQEVHDLLQKRRASLRANGAPDSVHARCAALAASGAAEPRSRAWGVGLAPIAVAASLVMLTSGVL